MSHRLNVLLLAGQFQRLRFQLIFQLLKFITGDESLITFNVRDCKGLDLRLFIWSVVHASDPWFEHLIGSALQVHVPGKRGLGLLSHQRLQNFVVDLHDLGRRYVLANDFVIICTMSDVGTGANIASICVLVYISGPRCCFKVSSIPNGPILVHRGLQLVNFEVQRRRKLRKGLVHHRLLLLAAQRLVEREVALVLQFHFCDPDELLNPRIKLLLETLLRGCLHVAIVVGAPDHRLRGEVVELVVFDRDVVDLVLIKICR